MKHIDYKNETFFENQILNDESLFTKKQIAHFLQISIKTIDKKVSMKEIPFIKIGKLVRFDIKRVRAWAEEKTISR